MNNRNVMTLAPLRVSLLGGGTDVKTFYSKTDGCVVSFAIKKYVYVHVKRHEFLFHEKYRISYSEIEKCDSRDKIKNQIIRSCLEYLDIDEPLHISISADIPSNSGLGSSSSFTVALLLALHTLKGEIVSKAQLAEEACLVEVDIMNSPIGKQDQYAAAFGGFNYFQFGRDGNVSIHPILLPKNILDNFLNNSLLIWTEKTREANKILSNQQDNFSSNFSNLMRLKDLTGNFFDYLKQESSDLHQIAQFINEGWRLKKEFSHLILDSDLDRQLNKIERLGVIGLKLLGAGGGGFFFALFSELNVVKDENLINLTYFRPSIDFEGARVVAVN